MENQTTQNNNKCLELTKLSMEVEFIKKRHFFKLSGWIYLASFAVFSIPTVISWWFMLKQPIATQGILKCDNVAELFNAQFANMLTIIAIFGGIIPLLAYWFQHRSFDKQQKQIDEILVSLQDKIEKTEVQNVFTTFSQNIKTGLDDIKSIQGTLQGTINEGLESIKKTTSQQFSELENASKQANDNFQNMFQAQNKQYCRSLSAVLSQVSDAFTAEEQRFICILSASFLAFCGGDKTIAKKHLEILLKRLDANIEWTSTDGYANVVSNIAQYILFLQTSENNEDIINILGQIREKISNKPVKQY